MVLYELWRDDGSMEGPYPGVLFGSLQYDPVPSIADTVARMSDEEVRELLAEAQRVRDERPGTPREAGIAMGLYRYSDAEVMRLIRKRGGTR
jgi:hypothetical protein